MKRTILTIILIGLSLLSFRLQKSQEDLIGKWSVMSSEYDGIKIMYNAGPKIEFLPNQKAIMTFSGDKTENYTWSVLDSILTLKSDLVNGSQPFFTDTNYSMHFESSDNSEIRLTNGRGTSYNLGKIKTGANK